jgi:DNA-binding NarL/FixJ family response regulator
MNQDKDLKILIAARDTKIRSSLRFLIKYGTENIRTEAAIDLLDLLEKLRSHVIDLVLIEWEFFLGEALEMLALIKKAYPEVSFIAIGIMKENRKEAMAANLDAFYLKSDSPEELIKIIDGFRDKALR